MSSLDSTTPVHSPFLKLPTEIRLKIHTHLFSFPDPIKIEPAHPTSQAAFIFESDTNEAKETPWLLRQPTTSGLSSQLLRTCRKIRHESLAVLYQTNSFDCSAREGVALLQHNIGPSSFSLIHHLILDWEQLQDFAWSQPSASRSSTWQAGRPGSLGAQVFSGTMSRPTSASCARPRSTSVRSTHS